MPPKKRLPAVANDWKDLCVEMYRMEYKPAGYTYAQMLKDLGQKRRQGKLARYGFPASSVASKRPSMKRMSSRRPMSKRPASRRASSRKVGRGVVGKVLNTMGDIADAIGFGEVGGVKSRRASSRRRAPSRRGSVGRAPSRRGSMRGASRGGEEEDPHIVAGVRRRSSRKPAPKRKMSVRRKTGGKVAGAKRKPAPKRRAVRRAPRRL